MLLHIKYIFIKLKLLKPTEKDISIWGFNNQIEKLEYILKFGDYNSRRLAAIAIGKTGNTSSIPVLYKAINDKVQNVSIAALNALDKIGCVNELEAIIIKKRFNWLKKIRENSAKYEANKNKKYKIYRWERASKKSFDRVKEQLKKPIR